MPAFLSRLLIASAAGLMVACGGGGGGANSPGGPGGGPDTRSCKTDFNPDRVAAGENCDPAQNRFQFCAAVPGTQYLRSRSEVIACDGVTVTTHTVSGGGFSNVEYLAIRPSGGGRPEAVYLALHYLGASTKYFSNLIRLSELAKARNVLVLVPQAPPVTVNLPLPTNLPGGDANVLSRWPTSPSQPVADYLSLLDAVVRDARALFGASGIPLYAAGLSNGAPMAYFLACGRANQVDAILSVAGLQSGDAAAVCQPSEPVGVVIIHGQLDPVVPYNGLLGLSRGVPDIYASFRAINQCSGTDKAAQLSNSEGLVEFTYTNPCAGGRRVVLANGVTNGHNWPGDDTGPLLGVDLDIGIFGPTQDAIDATIQGYDLLRYAAGN